jgi:phosphatidylglycerol:prolipoprotein diacylglycerol transferase
VHPVLFHIGSLVIPAYGVLAAVGVLLSLALALGTAPRAQVNPNQLWNLCIVALFVALAGSRFVLVVLNWTIVRSHPAWLLGLALIHHPLLAAVGASLALIAGTVYGRLQHMPLRSTSDALAAPVALGLSFEQMGALLAGSGYGTETNVRWAVVYTHPLAARWSGAPLFIPVHPVQAYASLAFFIVAIALFWSMPYRGQLGDIAGLGLIAIGAAVFFTEFWRDPEGRGSFLRGAFDGPQLAAAALVVSGALVLLQRNNARLCANPARTEAHHD